MKRIIIIFIASAFLAACSKSSSNNSDYQTNCATSLAGLYTGVDYCTGSGKIGYPATITAINLTNIMISNLYGITVSATVDCYHSSITIPNQASGNYAVYGSGTYTATSITINWTGTTAGRLPVSCSTTYSR